MKQRNCTIDCLKFLFAWVVVLFHFYGPTHKHFIGGFIAVEYFLLVASVFVYEKHEKMENDILVSGGGYIDNYIVSRFKRIFPWSASALLFAEIVIRIILPQNLSLGHILDNLTYDFSEMLLLKMNGIATTSAALLNGPSWTISSMLLVEFLLWYCLSQHKKLFTDLIAPISIIVGLGIWAHVEDTQVKTWMGITTFGTFRTWVVYCEGYYCWQLSKKMRSLKLNKCGEMLFLVVECFIYVLAIWVIMNRATKYYQWAVTFLFVIAIAISLSNHSLLNQWLNKSKCLSRSCTFLGTLSLSVFLMHGVVLSLFSRCYPDPEIRYIYKFYMIGVVLFFSTVQWAVVPKCVHVVQKLKKVLKEKMTMINNDNQ